MSIKISLNQAIAAARVGKTEQARILVNRILQDEPDNANAWVLLGSLAETKEEQIASLRQALAIDPNHEQANRQLAQLSPPAETVITPPIEEPEEALSPDVEMADEISWLEEMAAAPETVRVADEPLDFIAQAAGDTIPAWLAEQLGETPATLPAAPAPAKQPVPELEELPDWLQPEPDQEWLDKELPKTGQVVWKAGQGPPPVAAAPGSVETTRQAAKQQSAAPRNRPAEKDNSGLFLALLALLAVIVFLALLYVIIARPL